MSAERGVDAAEDLAVSSIVFGRSKALKLLSAALMSVALQVAEPRLAKACDTGIPFPCYGLPQCDCCSGSSCCWDPDCNAVVIGCPSGAQCWFTCTCTGQYYQCCDYEKVGVCHCICSGLVDVCPTC